MRSRWKGGTVRGPEITAGGAATVGFGQRGPQLRRALFAAISQRPGHDLPGASAKGNPQPKRLRLGTDKAPEFIEFQHVAPLAGQERVYEGGQAFRFFPPATS